MTPIVSSATGDWSAVAPGAARGPDGNALVVMRPGSERMPLVCVHGEPGHLRLFENLARHLDPARPVYGLRGVVHDLPPHAPYRRFEEMAQRYVRELNELTGGGPYLVVGECNGAALACELARQLEARGSEVSLLALVDSFGPGEPRVVVRPFAYRLANTIRMLAFHASAAARMRAPERRAYVAARVRRIVRRAATKAATRTGPPSPEQLRQHAFREAAGAYRPGPYPGRLMLLRGKRLPWGVRSSRDLGWSHLAAGVETIELDAYFGTCLLEPVVSRLGEAIERVAAAEDGPDREAQTTSGERR